jgi:hypothetical protein
MKDFQVRTHGCKQKKPIHQDVSILVGEAMIQEFLYTSCHDHY